MTANSLSKLSLAKRIAWNTSRRPIGEARDQEHRRADQRSWRRRRSRWSSAAARPKVMEMMIQPIVSSMIEEEMITWPRLRRVKFMSRTTAATILIEEIDSAVPRNSAVSRRLSASGSSDLRHHDAERHAAGERNGDAAQRDAERGAAEFAHQLEVGLHAGQQQQAAGCRTCEIASSMAFCSLAAGNSQCCRSGQIMAEHRRSEQNAGEKLAHHRRLTDPLHRLAEQAAEQDQGHQLGKEDDFGG